MKRDPFSEKKKFMPVRDARVAYYEEGDGVPVLLLHGCPFSSFIWRKVISLLSPHYRCLAPDLLGLGDTETPKNGDWSLRAQARMTVGFLDALGIKTAHVVGHDHGGAVAQLLADLKRFDHPTLLLWGEDDVHFGIEWGQRLLEDIPGAIRLEVLQETGHLVMEEQPELFAEHVHGFLSDSVDEKSGRTGSSTKNI